MKPAIADGESKGPVVAGIMPTQAGAGQVAELNFQKQRLLRFHKNVRSERRTRREIDLRSIARRNIVSAENDATFRGEVRNNLLSARKIPFPNRGLDAAAIHRAFRRKNNVDRHHINSPLEIAAKNSGEMIGGKHASRAPARIEELSVIGFAQTDSAAGEKAQLPGTFLNGILGRGLRSDCRTRKEQQDENTKNLHALPHALPPVSRSPETHSASKYAAEIQRPRF